MSREQLRDARERAKMDLDERKFNANEDFRRDQMVIDRALAVADNRNATVNAASAALTRMETLRENEVRRQEKALGVPDLRAQVENALPGEDVSELNSKIAALTGKASVQANEVLSLQGFFEAQEGLTLRLQREGLTDGPLPGAPTMESLESIASRPVDAPE